MVSPSHSCVYLCLVAYESILFISCYLFAQIQLNALACIDKLLDSLDKMMILDEVLPFLTELKAQDVDIIMAIIGKSDTPALCL